MANKSLLTASHVRYLMALKRLNRADGIKGSEIAEVLKLTRPSVHNMMDTFIFMEYIEKEPGGQVFLTEYGLRRAVFLRNSITKSKTDCFRGRIKMMSSTELFMP